ncbi:MAG TPA: type I phosphomannose isomerase catalytic subunit [Candidatus Acidoferrales bacterium]|nr:type I phosphomannose isomerase catalytic subunit [Candidatus Acidoferrales bacterium]
MKPEPTLLEPIFSPRIWGSRSLAPLFPEKSNLSEPLGEAWLTGRECRIVNGPHAGRTLGAAWKEMPAEWRGTRLLGEAEFPLLAKFIFPEDKLSIQVHPDDAYASRHEAAAGGRGKTEVWYAVAARPGATLLLGFRKGVTPEQLCQALPSGDLEEMFERVNVSAGDVIFVPAGTPHTIGPGMVLCEIQEYSDLTYRVYDYNRRDSSGRPRELHVGKALAVMNFGASRGGKIPSVQQQAGALKKTYCAACPYFAVEKWEFLEAVGGATGAGQFEVLIFLSGSGRIRSGDSEKEYRAGQAWLLPASLGKYGLVPQSVPRSASGTALLRAYVPELKEFEQKLARAGLPGTAVSRIVFA